MSFKLRRAQRLGGASLLLLGAATSALAEDKSSTEIPAVTVTAPSPIVRRAVVPTRNPGRPTRTARARSHQRAADATPATSTPAAPQQGVLPIVTNQFATVTVVPNEEIRREGGGQLGDLLFSKPGITGSSFAPGASSRPIIRGLDVNRVGIVENGTNAGGASDLGEDHFVPIDPLATNQVEVVRGPAALRYGSTVDRRRRQRHQQPDSRRAADLRSVVPDLRHADEGTARSGRDFALRHRRDAQRVQFG
ncbi:outer membrane receptor protein involved in Fe transport [Bradyrhizobium sp. GM7.3]